MNIFLTGASGTGKTTVAKLLAEHYDMELVPSLSRTSPHKIGTEAHQRYISERMFMLSMNNINSVFDRTPMDIVGYDLAYDFAHLATDSLMKAVVWKRTNPIIIYFPVYWKPEDDGFRPTDGKITESVDIVIKTQLSGQDYLTMDNESPEARLSKAIQYINLYKEA